jgi:hypothetical protein
MAYEVIMDRVVAPHRYTESTGAIADHSTPEEELAVNERGAPLEAFRVLSKGDILYTDDADLNSLSDEQKQKAGELLWVKNERYLNEHTKLNSLRKLEAAQPRTAEPQPNAGAPEDKSASRRGGAKRGPASAAGDQ